MSVPVPAEARASLTRVIDALHEAGLSIRQRGDHADAQCPAHDDSSPSLSIDWKANTGKGMTMLYCHGGCDVREVLDALGLRLTDTYDEPPKGKTGEIGSAKHAQPRQRAQAQTRDAKAAKNGGKHKRPGAVEAEYVYADEDGAVLGWLVRHEGKQFRWYKAEGTRRAPGAPSRKPLYLLPLVVQTVASGDELHLTEGEKDADAIVNAGCAATTIPGGATVTKTGSPKGNLTEDHRERLRGAHVVIWADRDGPDAKNPERGYLGYRHAMQLQTELANLAASVRVVEAADGKDAADHLAAGYGLADVVSIEPDQQVPAEVRQRWAEIAGQAMPEQAPEEPAQDNISYELLNRQSAKKQERKAGGNGGGGGSASEKAEVYVRERFERFNGPEGPAIVRVEEDEKRIKRTELINADVRILRQVVRDLGEDVEAESMVDLEITKDGETHTLTSIPRQQFEDPTKWAANVPLPLTFPRGGQSKGQVANAIIQSSGVVPVETAYGLLGWREISPGRWVYLHAGGAIGEEGSLLGIRVEVSPRLRGFTLPPEVPTGDDLRTAYDSVMALTEYLPHRIAYPLIAGGCRAVLGDCPTSLFLLGRSATYKSGCAALIQQMFDPSARYNKLPAGAGEGAATAGALEHLLYEAGHTALVLDDLAPDRGSARSNSRGAEILRTAGNRQSKARLERDTNKGLKADKLPRAFVCVTGEDQPTVQSAERRTIYIKFTRGDVSIDGLRALSEPWMIQARPGVTAALAQRMAPLMPAQDWLEQQRDYWAGWLAAGYEDADGMVAGRCNTVAELAIGIRVLLDMVVEAGVVSRDEAAQRWHEAWSALRETLEAQFDITDRRSLPERFGELLRSAVVSHRAHLQSPTGGEPPRAVQFGWTRDDFSAKPNGAMVGWTDGQTLWLQPGSAFAVAEAEGRSQSDPLDVTQRALKGALVEHYPEAFEPAQGNRQPREKRPTVGGARQRVWELPYSWLYPDAEGGDDGGDGGSNGGDTPPPPDPQPSDPAPKQPVLIDEPGAETHSENYAQTREDVPTQPAQSATSNSRRKRAPRKDGEPRYRAAGVVADVDGAYLINGADQLELPPVETFSDLMAWAVELELGVQHDGARKTKSGERTGARDDAGLVVVMPRLAKKLGAPTKAPRRDKPIAHNHKTVKAMTSEGWKLGERGLQPYTQVWRADDTGKTGRAHFLVFPHWSSEPIFEDLPSEAAQVAYRLSLYVNSIGHQLVYTGGSTGVGMVRQLRAATSKPLTEKVSEVPPPGEAKDQAPVEDAEWDYWRDLTDDEREHCTHIVGVDINASYLAAAQSVVLGYGQPEHHTRPDVGDLRKQPGYWLIDPIDQPMPHPLMPDLLDPHGTGRREEPAWITTSRLMALHEAGITPALREAWIYPNAGTWLQVWAKRLRDAIYELKEFAAGVDDPDANAVLAEAKLTYAAGLGQLASSRWRKDSPLWLPHWNQSTKGLAQVNIWRKSRATGEQTGRYPVGISRDTIYYATTSSDPASLPLNCESGFRYDGPEAPYRIGHTKWSGTATIKDYLEARAVTDKTAHIEAMNAIWTTPENGDLRSE